ncbi:MAG TPA: hypothetical protein VGV37_03885 [Aliidongia sp.]|nr:hypothetical protein [Aliidongia sp.]HEV2673656.1 hypothetical protein [Aliidongia sp.]
MQALAASGQETTFLVGFGIGDLRQLLAQAEGPEQSDINGDAR